MTVSRAQKRLFENWVGIVLTVVSIIQGLAFNDLAAKLPDIYSFTVRTNNYAPLAHFIVCFVVLLRLFQTYVTAALHYEEWDVNIFDLILIFIIGEAEYFLFSTLDAPSFEIKAFHARLSIISTLGTIGYLSVIFRLKRARSSNHEYEREIKLQLINISGTAIVQLISIFIIFTNAMSDFVYALLATVQSVVLIFNTFYSIKTTFYSTEKEKIPKVKVIIKPAERKDVDDILDLVMKYFSYIFLYLFDNNKKTTTILKDILIAGKGDHFWGYRSFYLAFDEKDGRCVGMIMIDSESSPIRRYARFLYTLVIFVKVVLFRLGPTGLIRSLKKLRSASALTPAKDPNEIHIVYIATAQSYQRSGVGKQMIDFALSLAKKQGKDSITLDVRESNQEAHQFFKRQGFFDYSTIDSELDLALGNGRRIHMKKKV